MTCSAFSPDLGFVGGVLNYVDCQAQAIGGGGYQALATPGSTLSLVLTGLLTLFVALFGYRLLFGHTPGVRDGVLALVKIGVVLALAMSWAAYRTLVYDVALRGPAELAGDIGRPAGLPGAGGGLTWRLDNADRLIQALTTLGEGQPLANNAVQPPRAPYLNPGPATGVQAPQAETGETPRSPVSASWAFGGARILFLAGAAGPLAALRVIAGVLLALGPFFLAFLLFDATRGLFEGWLRVLAGAAIGALGTSIALGVELAFLEPRLAYLISLRTAGYAIPGAAVELLVVTLVFAFVLVAMLVASARVAYGFRFPAAWRFAPAQGPNVPRSEETRFAYSRELAPAGIDRSRATMIADAVAASQRREAGPIVAANETQPASGRSAPRPAAARDEPPPPPRPLGQSFRRTRNRASASASRRERGA
jgi:type IV secretion system protein VirB6